MSNIKLGFQTYTWQMSYEKYVGKLRHILDVIKKSDGKGIETEVCMMGKYYHTPECFKEELDKREIEFAALCLVCDWLNPDEINEEYKNADKAIEYLKHFPDAKLVLCQMPQDNRDDLYLRQKNVMACINNVARRAADEAVECTFHPNSPEGSIFRTQKDYEIMMHGMDTDVIGFTPDAGHIAKGGMDVLALFKKYRAYINHVHFKDIDAKGAWAAMDEGIIDFLSIVKYLKQTDYNGWIMVEEESQTAKVNPDEITIQNGIYIKNALLPCTKR